MGNKSSTERADRDVATGGGGARQHPPVSHADIKPEVQKLFEDTWAEIEPALVEVFAVLNGEVGAVSKRNAKAKVAWHAIIYNAATKDQIVGDLLYRQLDLWLDEHLAKTVSRPITQLTRSGDTDQVFVAVTRSYAAYQRFTAFGKVVFNYLGTSIEKRSKDALTLEGLFRRAFHKAVYEKVKQNLRAVIIGQVNSRRDGNQVDLAQLKNAVAIFVNIGSSGKAQSDKTDVYKVDFEHGYLAALRDAYSRRSSAELTSEGGHFTYLKWVESRQELELFLAEQLLRESSFDLVRSATEQTMIEPHYETIVEHSDSGCGVLLEDWKLEDLGRMYRLLKRVREQKALHLMGKALQARVQAEATEAMQNFNSATSDGPLSLERPLVTAMVELNAKYGGLIQERFEGSGIFYDCRKKAFNAVLKQKLERTDPKPGVGEGATEKKATSFPEVLATFCDAVMKRELKDVVDADAELERLDALLQVFTYVEEKDVFQEFYKARLAKRLLQTTPNEDLEKAFLERLQREMGKSFTHKMEGMLLDRESTKKHSEEFNRDAAGSSLESDFDVQVLTEANWPAYRADALTPPVSLRRCMDAFTRFYKKKYATRKLTWFNLLGSGVLRVTFAKGAKDVTLSLHQAAVLLTIDERGRASVREVGESMGLDAKGAKPHVASMYLHKAFGMLRRVDASGAPQPVAKTIGDEDLLELNDGFVHKMRKFKVPQAHVSSHGSGGMPTEQEIDARRKIQVDACVVRIMKSRKSLSYPELQDLVIQQLGKIFTPQPKLVKQRVEDLVTREYLQRHEDDAKMFDYLA